MRIEIDISKNVEQNAAVHYEAAKKSKRKLAATIEAIGKIQAELAKASKVSIQTNAPLGKTVKRKPEWYEKFRWYISSEGFLCIGGRDATTNEILMKKHLEPHDIVFHTEIAGSPFFIIKTKGNAPSDATLRETAIATASYSRAWKLGVAYTEVFYVNPEQVSKSAPSGEYIPKGAFMIHGKKNKIEAKLQLAVGLDKDARPIGGPLDAIKHHCLSYVIIMQGQSKASDVAKIILRKFADQVIGIGADEIIRLLPAGGCKIEAQA